MNDVYLTDKNGWDVLKDSNGRMLGAVKFKDDKVRIDITEYDHYGEEFDLNNKDEVREFIKAFSSIYDQCDNDRLRYDNDANEEYYKRDKIVSLVQEELDEQNRVLTREKNFAHAHDMAMAKIEVLNKLQKEINDVLD